RDRALRALRGLLEGVSSMDVRTSIVWDYAPAPESTEHVRLRDDYGLFIGGEFRAPADGRREPTVNPATEEPIAQIAWAGEADLRAGVVAIVPGDGTTGAALVRSDGIDKFAFTGSTAVGRDIQAALAGHEIGLTLELGGKSANIVFEDAALDQAVEGIVNGIF